MINEVFQHCPGIGPKWEERLKLEGFKTWDDCLKNADGIPFSKERKTEFLQHLQLSKEAHRDDDLEYLIKSFPNREHYRILQEYFHRATFFDIETTGIYWYESHATVITAFHKGELLTFVYDENLDDFLDTVDDSELLVSFNGNCFDIPFLEHTFHIPEIECPHIDLRWVAYHKGHTGGLKSIEKVMGIERPPEIRDIDGFEAVDLYLRWVDGDRESLDRLIKYCSADVVATYMVAEKICAPPIHKDYSFAHDDLFEMAMTVV